MSTSQQDTKLWESKLTGKKFASSGAGEGETFSKQDLPEKHRICKPGGLVTMDFLPDRLNVHVDRNDKFDHVSYG